MKLFYTSWYQSADVRQLNMRVTHSVVFTKKWKCQPLAATNNLEKKRKKKTGFKIPTGGEFQAEEKSFTFVRRPVDPSGAPVSAFSSRIRVQSHQPTDPCRTQRPKEAQQKSAWHWRHRSRVPGSLEALEEMMLSQCDPAW